MIWDYYERQVVEGVLFAVCKLCTNKKAKYSAARGVSGTMHRHLDVAHNVRIRDVMADVKFGTSRRECLAFKFDSQVKDEFLGKPVESNHGRHPEEMNPLQGLHRDLGVVVIGLADKNAVFDLPRFGPGRPPLTIERAVKVVGVNKRAAVKQMRLEGRRIRVDL